MSRFYGGSLSDDEKKEWQEFARLDGFDSLWPWIKMLIRNRIKELRREEK